MDQYLHVVTILFLVTGFINLVSHVIERNARFTEICATVTYLFMGAWGLYLCLQ